MQEQKKVLDQIKNTIPVINKLPTNSRVESSKAT
jgi:hypothetical protein